MAIQIIAVRMAPGGTQHEHIVHLRWTGEPNGASRKAVVEWIEKGNHAHVLDAHGGHRFPVLVVTPSRGTSTFARRLTVYGRTTC